MKLKHRQIISCNFKCKFASKTWSSNQKWNNNKCQCECKKYSNMLKKIIVGILAHVFVRIVGIQKVSLIIQ